MSDASADEVTQGPKRCIVCGHDPCSHCGHWCDSAFFHDGHLALCCDAECVYDEDVLRGMAQQELADRVIEAHRCREASRHGSGGTTMVGRFGRLRGGRRHPRLSADGLHVYEASVDGTTYWIAARSCAEALQTLLVLFRSDGNEDEVEGLAIRQMSENEAREKYICGEDSQTRDSLQNHARRLTEATILGGTDWP